MNKGVSCVSILIMFTSLFILVVIIHVNTASYCNVNDRAIFDVRGHEFQSLFRTLGSPKWNGWLPSLPTPPEYTSSVMEAVGLTEPCARCYADAYVCGSSNCKWACSTAGISCDSCLFKNDCIEKCHTCTGFPVSVK